MADSQSIILHQYEASPFSEKIRLALRLKNLPWFAVDAPVIMPKPDLVPLTGGYRRIPVMQIGSDIYCDTRLILRELEQRFPLPSLNLPMHEGSSLMLSTWSDRVWFQVSVAVIFGTIGDLVPEAFKKDRAEMSGREFDVKAMKAAVPIMKDQWRAHLMWIEERLVGGKAAGVSEYLLGTKAGLADVHAHMNVWFTARNVPDFVKSCFETAPLTEAWYNRLNEVKGRTPSELSGGGALAVAESSFPRLVAASTANEHQKFVVGEKIAVAPDDYGKDWVEGELVHADHQRVVLKRSDEKVGTINIHYPRAGYMVRRV